MRILKEHGCRKPAVVALMSSLSRGIKVAMGGFTTPELARIIHG